MIVMNDRESDRFWKKVRKTSSCWIWTAAKAHFGYGAFRIRRKTLRAHRLSYWKLVGRIPNGMELDHKCGNPACVNVAHLDPVSHKENMGRGRQKRRETCVRGHKFSETEVILKNGTRKCAECRRICGRDWYRRHAAQVIKWNSEYRERVRNRK